MEFILGRHLIKNRLGLTRLRLITTSMEVNTSVFWREFPDHLKLLFLELFRTESHADVTLLSTDEVKFQAHKVVLSGCSPVLKKVIDSRPPGEALVYQTGIESPELESILHLMYVGEGKFYEERRGEFVRAATDLEIEQIGDNDVAWHNFSDHLKTLLEDLFRTGVYSDVTLISEDKTQFRAHKIVLSACSPVLKEIIDSNPEGEHLVYHTGIERPELESMLHSMYIGEEKMNGQRREHFYRVAKELGVNEHFQFRDYKTAGKPYLKRHIQSLHKGIRYQCHQCDYKAAEKYYLRKHMKSIHEGILYPCNQCEYKAMERRSLKRHIEAKHEGVRYPCPDCDYKATEKGNLRRHLHVIHKSLKSL